METEEISFEDLGLNESILNAIAKKGFVTPSPIQVLAIPRLLNGDANVIARARTGTGKTAAFGLPLVQKLCDKAEHVRAIVLEPTRELAVQACEEIKSFSESAIPRTCVLYGGASMVGQMRELKKGVEIVVGTPGRVKDHIERGTLDLSKIEYFILDEGDEMLDMGFIEDIENIFEKSNSESRILLFSATIPSPILKIAQKFMGEYEIVEEEKVVEEPLHIEQTYWLVKESDKIDALVRLIDYAENFYGLVFTQTKMDADTVTKMLDERGYEAAALHGDIMQSQREKVLARFRKKKTRILVATDVAARGIDITGLTHVVNYSLPFDSTTYIHRIGRTGRAGSTGFAFTFIRPEELRKLGFMQKKIQRSTHSELKEGMYPTVEDVIAKKRERLFAELKNNVEKSDIAKIDLQFTEMTEALCKESDAKEVLASVLSIMYKEKLDPKLYGKIAAVKKSIKSQKPKEVFVSDNQMRLYVQLGRKDGMGARELADYLSKLLKIPGKYIDKIDMSAKFSLVTLPIASAKKALELSRLDANVPHFHVDSKTSSKGASKKSSLGGAASKSTSRKTSAGKSPASKSRSSKAKSVTSNAELYKKSSKKSSASKNTSAKKASKKSEKI